MKLLKRTTQILAVILIVSITQSCGSSKEQIADEQLSSFMLGGIYFFNGYGGVDEVKKMMSDAGYTSDEELVSGYKEILEFPFETSQKSGIKNMFRTMWDVTDKASLLSTIEDLKTRDYKYKSWDYARIVNNACMGYAAEYLSKEEVIEIIKEVLPLAREKYENWDVYYTDFNLGRVEWNSEDPDGAAFKTLSENITKGEKSIYNILPLHTKAE
ncbi:hypothetical protein GCM10022393_22600 [Aquimarina addita]|uniref:DUF1266 domain-containing protein n=1 Tax=Aquimarina addita TaxID=870485 RepID=A0ABP6UJ89_9FLAO